MLNCEVHKRLDGFRLDVSLHLRDHVAALFGPSGSGKSMTLQCIAGLITPDSGRIEIGRNMVFDSAAGINLPPRRRRTGYVFQSYALFPHLSVAENVGYGLHALSETERSERIREIMRAVRLEGLETRRPAQLSGGQQQRVVLARALVTRPDVLLLDEPFSALDGIIRTRLHQELLQILQELPIPTLLVTHDLEEAYALSTEIAVFEDGRVLQFDSRDEVYYKPSSKAVARFVGMKNFLPGLVEDVADGYTRVQAHGLELTVLAPRGQHTPGQEVECCIRPEDITLLRQVRDEREPRPGETWITGMVIREMAYGGLVTVLIRPVLPAAKERTPSLSDLPVTLPDLHVTLPAHRYHRLAAGSNRLFSVILKAEYIHLLPVPLPGPDRHVNLASEHTLGG